MSSPRSWRSRLPQRMIRSGHEDNTCSPFIIQHIGCWPLHPSFLPPSGPHPAVDWVLSIHKRRHGQRCILIASMGLLWYSRTTRLAVPVILRHGRQFGAFLSRRRIVSVMEYSVTDYSHKPLLPGGTRAHSRACRPRIHRSHASLVGSCSSCMNRTFGGCTRCRTTPSRGFPATPNYRYQSVTPLIIIQVLDDITSYLESDAVHVEGSRTSVTTQQLATERADTALNVPDVFWIAHWRWEL